MAVLAAVSLLFVTLLGVWIGRTAADQMTQVSLSNDALKAVLRTSHRLDIIRGDVYAILMARTDDGRKRVRKALTENVGKLLSGLDRDVSAVSGVATGRFSESTTGQAEAAMRLSEALDRDRLAGISALGNFLRLHDEAREEGDRLVARLEEMLRDRRATSVRSMERATAGSVVISLVVVVLAFLVVGHLSRDVARSIASIAEHAQTVADGDLTAVLDADGVRELDDLGRTLGAMTRAVRDSVARLAASVSNMDHSVDEVQEASAGLQVVSSQQIEKAGEARRLLSEADEQVANVARIGSRVHENARGAASEARELRASAAELSHHANELSKRVAEATDEARDVAAASTQVAGAVTAQAEAAQESAEVVSATAEAAGRVKRSSETARERAERAMEVALTGASRVAETLDGFAKIMDAETRAREAAQQLGSRADRIGAVVNVIDSISEETRLLALNAAIIAARAGSEGGAFAVVASEIRALAERASESTREIATIVEGVRRDGDAVVEAIAESYATVEGEWGRSRSAAKALDEIRDAISENRDHVLEIEHAAESQESQFNRSRERIQALAVHARSALDGTNVQEAAVGRMLATFEGMNELSRGVASASEEQLATSRHIEEIAQQLRDSGEVVERVVGAHGETSTQTRAHIEALGQLASEASEQLEQVLATLVEQSRILRRDIGGFSV